LSIWARYVQNPYSLHFTSPWPYRVQLLDASKNVLSETQAEWWSATNVFELVPKDWPPDAVRLRVLDPYGENILTVSKGEMRA